MAKVTIIISDGENGMVNYQSQIVDELESEVEMSGAIALASMLIQYIENLTAKETSNGDNV
jgi:hypothetical protein